VTRGSRPAAVVCAAGLLTLSAGLVAARPGDQASRYGVFTGMEAVEGDYSGFEIFVLPSSEGDFVVFQMAEGWPSKPLLLAAARTSDSDSLAFEHPEMGPFRGAISGDSLIGEFTRMRYTIRLARGPSIWQ
jgi:hypothetical protein